MSPSRAAVRKERTFQDWAGLEWEGGGMTCMRTGDARSLFLVSCCFFVIVAGVAAHGESPPGSAPAGNALPKLAAEQGASLRGVIQHSTRGRGKGAVRLDVLSDSGEAMAVLTVPDATLDTLGLSLRRAERIEARGTLVPGKVPLFVASEIVVEGRAIPIRKSLIGRSPRSPKPTPGTTASPGA